MILQTLRLNTELNGDNGKLKKLCQDPNFAFINISLSTTFLKLSELSDEEYALIKDNIKASDLYELDEGEEDQILCPCLYVDYIYRSSVKNPLVENNEMKYFYIKESENFAFVGDILLTKDNLLCEFHSVLDELYRQCLNMSYFKDNQLFICKSHYEEDLFEEWDENTYSQITIFNTQNDTLKIFSKSHPWDLNSPLTLEGFFSNEILQEPIENLNKSYQSLEELDHVHINLYFQKDSEMKQELDKMIEMIAD